MIMQSSVMMVVQLRAVLLFGILTPILGWRPFKVELGNVSMQMMHPEVIELNVTIRNKSIADVNANILRDLPQIFVDFEILHDSGNGKYDMVYTNKTVDICTFLNNRRTNIFFDMAYRVFSDYADLPKQCPIRKKRYNLHDVFIDPEKFPPFMPDHKAKASVVAWNKQYGKKNILLKGGVNIEVKRSFKNKGKS